METIEDANSKLFPANEQPDLELYTIPSYSSWFSWNEIHETEKISLKEFFNGSSISKTPKIYKDYRDFIINKYREDPSRRLKFTEIRKSLIGDVSLIHKVFNFLEKWGLINFSAPAAPDSLTVVADDVEKQKVVFEEGAPNGVRVVAFPNSSKVLSSPPASASGSSNGGEGLENGFRLPPLASYSDVFRQVARPIGLKCANCGEFCASGSYEWNKKENIVTCSRCLKIGKNEGSKAVDDLKLNDPKDDSDNRGAVFWTDGETLLLLESVQLYGDDWDLVAQNVRTKSRSDCIAKLLELPFGELMLSTTNGQGGDQNSSNNIINITEDQSTPFDPKKPIKTEELYHKQVNESEQTEDGDNENPPLKRRCMDSFADASDSLMKQVAHLSTMVSPHVAAAAVEAAITALCEENPYARMIIESEGDNITNVFGSPTSTNEPKRSLNVESSEITERHSLSETQEGVTEKNSTSATLRIRTAIATAFGAAAAHAKLLAAQEDREIERLVATVVETQLRKINCKIKHFEELQLIMENEYTQLQELKESIIAERIDVLRQVFNGGITRWRDHSSSVKTNVSNVF